MTVDTNPDVAYDPAYEALELEEVYVKAYGWPKSVMQALQDSSDEWRY